MTGQVGPRGLAVLVLAGITGIFLAILGWSQRGTGLPAPGVRGLGSAAPTHAAPAYAVPAYAVPAYAVPAYAVPAYAVPAYAVAAKAGAGRVPSAGRYASFGYLVWPETQGAGRLIVTTVPGPIVP
jgi:hypothetical protein